MDEPRIDGLEKSYIEGEIVSVNCSSSPSDPAPILSWYINNKQVYQISQLLIKGSLVF